MFLPHMNAAVALATPFRSEKECKAGKEVVGKLPSDMDNAEEYAYHADRRQR